MKNRVVVFPLIDSQRYPEKFCQIKIEGTILCHSFKKIMFLSTGCPNTHEDSVNILYQRNYRISAYGNNVVIVPELNTFQAKNEEILQINDQIQV